MRGRSWITWTRACIWSVLLAGLPATGGARGLDHPLVFAQEPVDQGECGSRIASLQADGRLAVLTEGFCAAADPCVSFDGQRLLYAGKRRAGDRWEIWEMGVDGSRKLQVTADQGDCREPIYLAKAAVDAPNFRDKVRWIAFTSTAPAVLNGRGNGPLTSLYAMSLTPVPGRGTVLWRTTYNLGGDAAPTILADGRVLFSAWQRTGRALMTISWAGENLNPLYGSHDGAVSQLEACELPEQRRVVFVESEGEPDDRSGRLAQVSFRRPLHSHQVLSQDGGRYRTPAGLPDGRLVVAHASAEATYGIYLFDEKKGRPGRRIYDAPEWHDVDPQPVLARPEPIGRIPMVEFASVLDVGGFGKAGQLQCLNVYESDRREAAAIAPGQVKKVRLVEGLPVPLSDTEGLLDTREGNRSDEWPPPFVRTRSLGETTVEEDGSFFVNVAGDIPFYVETLDENGQVLMTMRTWIWVRSGDQRGCVGCHENKEMGPENRATQALIRARPAMLMGPRRNGEKSH